MNFSFISIPNLPYKYNSIGRLFALFLYSIANSENFCFSRLCNCILMGGLIQPRGMQILKLPVISNQGSINSDYIILSILSR